MKGVYKMTVYQKFVLALLQDEETQHGGIIKNEKKWLDKIGFEYSMKSGMMYGSGKDLTEFYKAIATLIELQKKYKEN